MYVWHKISIKCLCDKNPLYPNSKQRKSNIAYISTEV